MAVDQRSITRAAYAVGIIFMITPVLNLITAMPFQVTALNWRVQQYNLFLAGMQPATLGLAIVLYTARALEHRRLQLMSGVVAALLALALLGLTANYILDVLELRAVIAPAGKQPLLRLGFKSLIQALAVIAALGAISVPGFRGARSHGMRRRTRDSESEPLLLANARAVNGLEKDVAHV